MGTDLAARGCVPCHGGTPPVPAAERPGLLEELPGWSIEGGRLTRTVAVADFAGAAALVGPIAALADREHHHPDLRVSYGSLRIDLVTHAIGDLSDNDFILAAKLNLLLPPP